MRNSWHNDSAGRRLLRLSFVILGFLVPYVLAEHGLALLGASNLDARGGASIVALTSAAFALYY